MRDPRFTLFSDIDCVLIVDDRSLLSKSGLTKFLREIFKEIDTVHYNLPNKKEIEWFRKSIGVARCGLIKNGIFVNFKIITKKALHYSIMNFCTQSLKESNQGYFLIPDFNNKLQTFIQKNSIPVYPFVKDGFTYKICRGLIPEFLHTGKIMAGYPSLKKELISLQKTCIAKSIGFIKAYNPYFRKNKILNQILEISYTPKQEMTNKRKKLLMDFYDKIIQKMEKSIYFETFLARLYGETIIPLLEKNSRYWSYHNLLCFFLGAPGISHSSTNRIKQIFFEYFRRIKHIQDNLTVDYVHLIINGAKNSPDILLKLHLSKKEKILLATSLMDIIEKFCINRSDFYDINEIMFKRLFPKEFQKAYRVLKNLLIKVGGRQKLTLLVKNMERELKEVTTQVVSVKYRIREPAGLYQHHLMKRIPLKRIDDIVSIQIRYKDKSKTTEIVRLVSEYLKRKFKTNIRRKVLRIGKYRGYHFYFQYNTMPFEVMIRDLRSDTSIEHKIEHSTAQKKYHRLKICKY